jgi:hypothetical protein
MCLSLSFGKHWWNIMEASIWGYLFGRCLGLWYFLCWVGNVSLVFVLQASYKFVTSQRIESNAKATNLYTLPPLLFITLIISRYITWNQNLWPCIEHNMRKGPVAQCLQELGNWRWEAWHLVEIGSSGFERRFCSNWEVGINCRA